MDERAKVAAEPRGCPFAVPAVPSTKAAAFYCRLPGGRVRVPTPHERVVFCLSGRYFACPAVRRYVND
jgi:hypothetical protein